MYFLSIFFQVICFHGHHCGTEELTEWLSMTYFWPIYTCYFSSMKEERHLMNECFQYYVDPCDLSK